MFQHSVRVPGRVPKLAGQRWLEVAPYLEEFLKRLTEANDVSQTSLYTLSAPVEATDPPFRPRPPIAHRHLAEHIDGLEPTFRRRPPSPHTHAIQDVIGSTPENVLEPRKPQPHTHQIGDVIGSAPENVLEPRKPQPHTHLGVDLHDVLALENTGSPGAALLLGDFILASQIFGG